MSGEIHSGAEDVHEPEQKLEELHSSTLLPETPYVNAPYFCEICNVRAFSLKIYQNHLEGRKHIKRQQRNGKVFKCELCQVIANGQTQLETHLRSMRHKEQVARKERLEFMSLSYSKGTWIIIFGALCVFLNLLILFNMII